MRFYIDPGTGSMLFTVLIGLISAGIYALRGLLIKLRFSFGASKEKTKDENINDFVIYSDSKRYWNTFKPICDEFEKRETNLLYLTQSEDDPAFKEDYKHVKCEFIGEGNKGFTKLNFLKANVVLSTTPGLDVYQWKRSKDVKYYIHVLHMPNDVTTYRMFGLDYYDAIILSGEYQVDQIRKLEELRNLPAKDLPVLGLPYLDELKKKLDNNKIKKNITTTVLVAPSWGKSAILNVYGEQIIDELLKTGYEIIVRPHPQSFISEKDMIDKLMKKYPQIEWNRDNDNFDVLNKADILISDFSGVMFDFSLVFDKPIIYADTSFDKSPYDAHWLKEDLWTFKVLPTIGKQLSKDNLSNIKEIIDECINDKKYAEGRLKAKKESWQNESNSAKSIVEYLIKKNKEIEN